MVVAYLFSSGSMTVSFEDCTMTSNRAQVSTRSPIIGCCMQGSGSVHMNAVAPSGVRRLDALGVAPDKS